jgi:hypothetical protein
MGVRGGAVNRFLGASSAAVRLFIGMMMSSALVGVGATLASATERSTTTTTTTFLANVRQPPQETVHLGRASTPPPLISAGLAKKYPTILPLLKAGLRVFAAVEESGHRVRVTALDPESSVPFPGDPKASIPNPGEEVDLPGTVVDESGRSWVLDVNTVTNNVIAGSVSLVGLCGHGRPAPVSQGPGTINYPCRELQIEFSNGNLNPHRATLASWATVQSITRLPLDGP